MCDLKVLSSLINGYFKSIYMNLYVCNITHTHIRIGDC